MPVRVDLLDDFDRLAAHCWVSMRQDHATGRWVITMEHRSGGEKLTQDGASLYEAMTATAEAAQKRGWPDQISD